jgi:hypothetical protein
MIHTNSVVVYVDDADTRSVKIKLDSVALTELPIVADEVSEDGVVEGELNGEYGDQINAVILKIDARVKASDTVELSQWYTAGNKSLQVALRGELASQDEAGVSFASFLSAVTLLTAFGWSSETDQTGQR